MKYLILFILVCSSLLGVCQSNITDKTFTFLDINNNEIIVRNYNVINSTIDSLFLKKAISIRAFTNYSQSENTNSTFEMYFKKINNSAYQISVSRMTYPKDSIKFIGGIDYYILKLKKVEGNLEIKSLLYNHTEF